MAMNDRKLKEALSDIVTGRITRSKHELVLNGQPVVDEFIEVYDRYNKHKP